MKDRMGTFLMNWRISVVLPLVKGTLLDIGCGTNQLVRRYGGEGLGVDIYPWGDVDLLVEDASRLPVAEQTFDTVTIVAALNHIPNRREVLQEIHRVMKDDGRLIITMINPHVSRVWHRLRKPWDADQRERGMAEGEVYGFTRKDLRDLLISEQFEIRGEKPFMLHVNRLICAKKAHKT